MLHPISKKDMFDPQPALAYKQERQSPKAPRKKKDPLILTNRVISFILIFLIKPKY